MKDAIVKFCSGNKIAISFDSEEKYRLLCDYFGVFVYDGPPSQGIVSFFELRSGNVVSAHRWTHDANEYWDWHGYETITSTEFFELCSDNSILEYAK